MMPRNLAISTMSLMALALPALAQTPLGTHLTYQGQLKGAGMPDIGTADFRLALFDAETDGSQVGSTLNKSNVAIVGGLFTISLDFGAGAFSGDARWIEVAVRSPSGAGGFTTLTPRQPLTATPYALHVRGLTVDGAGNVGIGTQLPSRKLTVAGDMELGVNQSDYRHLRIGGGSSDGFIYGSFPAFGDGIHMGYNFFADSSGAGHIIHPDGGTSRLSLGYGTIVFATRQPFGIGSPPVERMVIDELGKVGIGTTSPEATLDVNGNVNSTGGFSTNHSYRYVGNDGNEFWKMGARGVFPICSGANIEPFLELKSPYTGDVMVEIYRDCLTARGTIVADEKNFRAPNPADLTTDIWYCCPEGPEAAMYIRGTAQLRSGRARIELPEHFRLLASEPGMTVQLTPRSLESRGLATSRVSLTGIEVGELRGGTGNYDFDWRVEAVRKGWENYQVIRPWKQSDADRDEAWRRRMNGIAERKAHGRP